MIQIYGLVPQEYFMFGNTPESLKIIAGLKLVWLVGVFIYFSVTEDLGKSHLDK